jgi:hypothetical protein
MKKSYESGSATHIGPESCGAVRKSSVEARRETGDVQLSRLHARLREEEEQWTVYGVAADDPQTVAGEAERGESRASATDARTHPRSGQMAASGGAWSHPILRSAHEPTGAVSLSTLLAGKMVRRKGVESKSSSLVGNRAGNCRLRMGE